MTPALALTLLDGLISMIEKLTPTIGKMVKGGQITVADQKERMDRIAALSAPTAFDGPEWEVG